MKPTGIIEDIIAKCAEINAQTEFILTLAGKASDPKWVENDPGYTHVVAVYNSSKAKLVQLVGELP